MSDFKNKLVSAYKSSELFIYNNKIDSFISKEIESLIIDNVIQNNLMCFDLDLDSLLEKTEYNDLKKRDVVIRIEKHGCKNSYKLVKESVRANPYAKESMEYMEKELQRACIFYAGTSLRDYYKKEIDRYRHEYGIMIDKYSILVDDISLLDELV